MGTATALRPTDRPLGADLMERRVAGYGIAAPATLRSVLEPARPGEPGLLVFLRHYG